MKIDGGLFEHMVLQRNAQGVSDARLSGSCGQAGAVVAKVTSKGKAVRGFAGTKVGAAAKGRFAARLAGLPTGGPYAVELSIGPERLSVRDVLVGDVWLLGGQSNMQGVGLLKDALPPRAMTRAFYMDDRWGVAKDPLHELYLAVDEVHARLGAGKTKPPRPITGVGPGVSFAQEMLRRTGVPQGLLACAHGGTSMDQWDPALKKLGGTSLYGAMLRRFFKNGGRVAGLLWYQGESDADKNSSRLFTARMVRFVRALRRDTGQPALAVAMVQISRVLNRTIEAGGWWNSIQEQQRRLGENIGGVAVVPAIDLPLDDSIHVSGEGMKTLGVRLADAMLSLTAKRPATASHGSAPIQLKSIALKEPRPGFGEIHVSFVNVQGELAAPGRAVGFALGTPLPVSGAFDVQLRGRTAVVRTIHSAAHLGGMMLYYGPGCEPVCNIVDGSNRSLPVFGPLPLGRPRPLTPFVRRLRMSGFLPSAGRLEKLELPDMSKLELAERQFPADFCDIHTEVQARGGADELVIYACDFQCPEPMRLKVEIGYDGPAKAWLDGKNIYHDPNGTNPAVPADKGKPIVRAGAGRHELIVALGTNHGAAWGVYLRFERLDVSPRQMKIGPTAYAMPEVLG